jgi:hypothetical protein
MEKGDGAGHAQMEKGDGAHYHGHAQMECLPVS